MRLITATPPPPSLRGDGSNPREPLRVGLVQHRWRDDDAELSKVLDDAIGTAADAGAQAVFLPELTLSKYPAAHRASGRPGDSAEPLTGGPTYAFAAAAAAAHDVIVHASLYERADADDGRGYNTAIMVAPDGTLLGRTRKLHIPVTAGYYEDTYFRPGPSDDAYPVYRPTSLPGAAIGLPTCWDEWFPEVARAYGLAGANLLA
ncbi:MAG: hydrolase, partial [Actinomycetia bacterium]|nr:hydrolase [Actinomycetes bacterium]